MNLFSFLTTVFCILFSSYVFAQNHLWAWLYCVDSTTPFVKESKKKHRAPNWQYATYQNSEKLKPYKNFVYPYQSRLYPTGGIVLHIKDFHSEIDLNTPTPHTEFNWLYISATFLLDYKLNDYAIVDHAFETLSDAQKFCKALQNKCLQIDPRFGAVGYGHAGSYWVGLSAQTQDRNLVNCEGRFPRFSNQPIPFSY